MSERAKVKFYGPSHYFIYLSIFPCLHFKHFFLFCFSLLFFYISFSVFSFFSFTSKCKDWLSGFTHRKFSMNQRDRINGRSSSSKSLSQCQASFWGVGISSLDWFQIWHKPSVTRTIVTRGQKNDAYSICHHIFFWGPSPQIYDNMNFE